MGKLMTPVDLAHQIGLITLSKEVLIVGLCIREWRFKICEIRYVFAYGGRTSKDTEKRMAPSDLGHQIGLSTLLEEVLIVD